MLLDLSNYFYLISRKISEKTFMREKMICVEINFKTMNVLIIRKFNDENIIIQKYMFRNQDNKTCESKKCNIDS